MPRGTDWLIWSGLSVFVLLGFGCFASCTVSLLAPPPPGPPVPNGTTIAEFAQLQPGVYYRDLGFADLPKARNANAARLEPFHGPMRLRHPGVAETVLFFREGRRSGAAWNPAPPPALAARVPAGTPAREAIRRLHPKTDVRLADSEATMGELRLPGEEARYQHFTGRLWRIEDGADDGRIFRVWFRKGRTVKWDTHVIVG